jgi:hypothetical protein
MKTMKAYKLLRQKKDGRLFPLYVKRNQETPIGEWIKAEEGELQENGKVKASLGNGLCFRPGWHLALIPFADWIGEKQPDGTLARRKNNVWCEVEYPVDICYGPEARENGWRAGKWAPQRAYLKHIPEGGYYKFRTQAVADEWIIAGAMKITRVLSDEEVAEICRENGVEPQKVAE